jgi:hypothetical protein
MEIAATKIGDSVELFAEIFSTKDNEPSLTANKFTFKEITEVYKLDEVGDGFCTLTLEQVKKLHADLEVVIRKFE